MAKASPIVLLAELASGQEGDFFALMTLKDEAVTRDGKKYFRVGFRDAGREVNFPIWGDSPWANDCRDHWQPGEFYKLRGEYRETTYGPQLEIRRIRAVTPADRDDGFDPLMCQKRSRFDPGQMYAELVEIAATRIRQAPLSQLVLDIYEAHREAVLTWPAARRNHHAYVGGYLEHVLSVTRNGLFLAEKYARDYPDLDPPLDQDLVVAGCLLHDIGKLRELSPRAEATEYSAAGHLIGHVLQGRDIVREAAAGRNLDPEQLLRLEHIIVSHQRLPEWGAPKPPMTPEAMLVHFADDVDAKFNMMQQAISEAPAGAITTSTKNPLGQILYRGPAE